MPGRSRPQASGEAERDLKFFLKSFLEFFLEFFLDRQVRAGKILLSALPTFNADRSGWI
jgi:hypothetical protein